jgi:endo-1,4-beta-D-glucanase Y
MKKAYLLLTAIAVIIAFALFFLVLPRWQRREKGTLEASWLGYKKYFIESSGRVTRPEHGGDTVSEGQAYAMLRAVWLDDKKTFDKCYGWAEKNLSRRVRTGDNLLAWHWKDGGVSDWMPASDADLDYVIALAFASRKWKTGSPEAAEGYLRKARAVAADILRFETARWKDVK